MICQDVSDVSDIKVVVFFDRKYIDTQIARARGELSSDQSYRLCSSYSRTRVSKMLPAAYDIEMTVSGLLERTPRQVREEAKIGSAALAFLEAYLSLFGVALKDSKSVFARALKPRPEEVCRESQKRKIAVAISVLPIRSFGLSKRVIRGVKEFKVRTIGDLARVSRLELLRLPNFGPHSVGEVKYALERVGLQLASN